MQFFCKSKLRYLKHNFILQQKGEVLLLFNCFWAACELNICNTCRLKLEKIYLSVLTYVLFVFDVDITGITGYFQIQKAYLFL